MTRDNITW